MRTYDAENSRLNNTIPGSQVYMIIKYGPRYTYRFTRRARA